MFRRMDTNNDGVLDKTEFQNAFPRGISAYGSSFPARPEAYTRTKKPSTQSAVPDHIMHAFGVQTDGTPVDFTSFLELVSASVTPAESLASSAYSTPMISPRSWASGTFTGPGAIHSARASYTLDVPPVILEAEQSVQPTQPLIQQSQPAQQTFAAQSVPSAASALNLNEEHVAIAAFACLTGGSGSINLEQWKTWAAQCPAAIHAMTATLNQSSVSALRPSQSQSQSHSPSPDATLRAPDATLKASDAALSHNRSIFSGKPWQTQAAGNATENPSQKYTGMEDSGAIQNRALIGGARPSHDGRNESTLEERQSNVDALFRSVDADANGSVSSAEFTRWHSDGFKAFEAPPNRGGAAHDFAVPVAAREPRAASTPPCTASPPPAPPAASFNPTRRPRQSHATTATTQSPLSFRNLSPTRKQLTPQPGSAPISASSGPRPSSANAVARSSPSPSVVSPAASQFFTKKPQSRTPLTFSKGSAQFNPNSPVSNAKAGRSSPLTFTSNMSSTSRIRAR